MQISQRILFDKSYKMQFVLMLHMKLYLTFYEKSKSLIEHIWKFWNKTQVSLLKFRQLELEEMYSILPKDVTYRVKD